MNHEYLLWIALLAYGIHMIEETVYNWRAWVQTALKMNAEWNEFYMVNAVVIVMGLCCAMIGWKNPSIALIFPAFMAVNAVLFHIIPVFTKHMFSPGVITSVVLFLPVVYLLFRGAYIDGMITNPSAIIIPVISGFILMFFPIILQKTKKNITRKYSDN